MTAQTPRRKYIQLDEIRQNEENITKQIGKAGEIMRIYLR